VDSPRAARTGNKIDYIKKHSTGAIADKLLSRLDGVKQARQYHWIALCPSHDDFSPSLNIRETDDRLLVHCFAGCSAYEIVTAVGLDLSDLFPERTNNTGNRRLSKPFPATDILRCLAHESLFCLLVVEAILKGEKLEEWDKERLLQSASRFRSALTAGGLS
jgi:hypothetical protein